MWLVSCTDPTWEGRRKWLRPGTKHLFGRSSTKPDEVDHAHYIQHKSVSRKHLVVTVDDAPSKEITNLHTKSRLTIIGQGKTGTWLDGQRLPAQDQTRKLEGNRHTVQLGNPDATLTLEWHPVVLAFTTGVPKAARAKGTALAAEREKLDRCDIKIATEYISYVTTHAIAKKRNTPAVLQALLQGKWVVAASFVDALAQACKLDERAPGGTTRSSPLEQDFDKHWPQELEHICPTGGEPVTRPDSWLKPDSARAELFQHYTFLFLDSIQHSTLAPVVNSGNGKALHYDFRPGETPVEELVNYVRDLTGKKSARRLILGAESGPGGIVMVRARDTDTFASVHNDLDAALGQRSIEQNEFLDAILNVDARMLQRPFKRSLDSEEDLLNPDGNAAISSSVPAPSGSLRSLAGKLSMISSIPVPPKSTSDPAFAEDAESQRPPTSAQGSPLAQPQEQTGEPSQAPTAKKRRRFITQKFQGFDDAVKPSGATRAPSLSPPPSIPQFTQPQSNLRDMDATESGDVPAPSQLRAQKRPVPVEVEDKVNETDEQRRDRMFPGQAALKRRKTEAAAAEAAKRAGSSATESRPASNAVLEMDEVKDEKTKVKGKQARQDVNLKAKITAKREAEEEQHRREEERLRQGLAPGQEVPDLGNVAKHPNICIEYDLPIRKLRPHTTGSSKPEWAGRPNYKKFKKRRPGDQQEGRAGTPISEAGVIIPLEEIEARGSGLGDEYWLEHGDLDPRHVKQRRSQAKSQTQSQGRNSQSLHQSISAGASLNRLGEGNAREEVDEEDRAVFRRRLQHSREQDQADAEVHAVFDAPSGSGGTSGSISQSTLGTDTQKKAAGKRPAASQLGPAAAKKAKSAIAATAVSSGRSAPSARAPDEDEDDDPRAFRRRKR